jgi:hypothetical protein
MEISSFLSQIVNLGELSNRNTILLVAYYLRKHKGIVQFDLKIIRNSFRSASLKAPSRLKEYMISLSKGKKSPLIKITSRPTFSLSILGVGEIESFLTSGKQSPTIIDDYLDAAIPYLEKIVSKIQEDNKRKFLSEAIGCLKSRAKRATVIMTWCAALDHMYDYVVKKKLSDFNSAISRRSDSYRKVRIRNKDDFSDVKESVFIEVCKSAGIIGKDVRKILDEKLNIRNTCAHPSDVEIHDSKVVNFIEDIVDNVIVKYQI